MAVGKRELVANWQELPPAPSGCWWKLTGRYDMLPIKYEYTLEVLRPGQQP